MMHFGCQRLHSIGDVDRRAGHGLPLRTAAAIGVVSVVHIGVHSDRGSFDLCGAVLLPLLYNMRFSVTALPDCRRKALYRYRY